MTKIKFVLPALVLMGGLLVSTTVSFGKAAYTAKEKKPCAACHTAKPPTGKDLTKLGECYGKSHTLTGCEEK